jgi:formate dehydrogenase major subunit
MDLSRRQFLKLSISTATVLGTGLNFDMNQAKAAAGELKLRGATEYPNICHFCSGGCGVIAHVRDGNLINLEGDPDHPTNKGSLCPKGAALGQVRGNARRITKPLYRAPGAKEWQPISWEQAIDKIARKTKETRDANWIEEAHRTDAIGILGCAEMDNEECYILTKYIRTIGSNYSEHQARV